MALSGVKNKYDVDAKALKEQEESLVKRLRDKIETLEQERKILEKSFIEDIQNRCLNFYEYLEIEEVKKLRDSVKEAGVTFRGQPSKENLFKLIHEKIFSFED